MLLLIISYLVVVNKRSSEVPKAVDFVVNVVVIVVVDVNVDVGALLVVTGQIIFSCGP